MEGFVLKPLIRPEIADRSRKGEGREYMSLYEEETLHILLLFLHKQHYY